MSAPSRGTANLQRPLGSATAGLRVGPRESGLSNLRMQLSAMSPMPIGTSSWGFLVEQSCTVLRKDTKTKKDYSFQNKIDSNETLPIAFLKNEEIVKANSEHTYCYAQ